MHSPTPYESETVKCPGGPQSPCGLSFLCKEPKTDFSALEKKKCTSKSETTPVQCPAVYMQYTLVFFGCKKGASEVGLYTFPPFHSVEGAEKMHVKWYGLHTSTRFITSTPFHSFAPFLHLIHLLYIPKVASSPFD